jgi:hypothetical protein
MANSISSEITSAVVVEKLHSLLAPVNAFTVDASETSVESGGTVAVPVVSSGSTLGGEFGGDYTANSASDVSKVSVSLKHYFRSWYVSDSEAATSSANRLQNLVGANISAFAKYLTNAALAKITKSSFEEEEDVADGSFALSNVKALVGALDTSGLDLDDRFLLLKTACHAAILPTDVNSYNVSALESGKLPQVLGLNVYPINATFDDDLNAIALHKTGMVAAFRNVPVQAPESLIDLQRIQLPNGIPVQLRTFSDVKSGKLVQVAETMAGFAVSNSDAIKTIAATAT